jgi:(R,R)-butanediol dehydrogenase/meso-butanediol dehydrogenase/diacetyl reductase
MLAAVYHKKNKIEVRTISPPKVPEGWATIKVDYCGICGTDLNIYGGGHPRAQGPLVMGHEFAGKIVDHPDLEEGTAVTVNPILSCGTCHACTSGYAHVCENLKLIGIDRDGAMAKYVVAPIGEIIPLPEEMSTKRGALVEPFAVAVHAVRESCFKPGDQVVVFGAGPIGMSTAVTLRLMGARNVIVVEVQPYRQQIADQLGFTVIDPQNTLLINSIQEELGGSRPDIVFDCAAHPSVAEVLVDVTKVKGEIVLVGTYKKPTSLDLQNITFKELSVKGTRVYTRKDYEIALGLLKQVFDFEALITHEIHLNDINKAFNLLAQEGDAVKVMVSIS